MSNIISSKPRITAAVSAICTLTTASVFAHHHEEFAETANHSYSQVKAPMVFRNGETHMRTLDNVNGVAISEGDIIFGDAEKFFSNAKHRSVRGLSNTVYGTVWPNGLVPYQISDGLSSSATAKIRSAIKRWNDTGTITMVERTPDVASAYPNYIDFIDADQCASWVGFQNSGPQSIYSGDKCSEGSMIHEIGHAFGLLHEHTRPDRDSYVQINWNSVATDKSHNFDILSDAITLGEYDYNSIMHYGTHFFSKDGQATITALQATNAQIGQREFISEGDEQSVRELYQSELSLVSTASDSVVSGDTVELEMFVTNNSGMGANRMLLETDVPEGSTLESFSSSSWICQQGSAGEIVTCQSPVLAKNASSSVTVSLSAPSESGVLAFDTTLSSNTFDTNMANNNDQATTTVVGSVNDLPITQKTTAEPTIAAANPTQGNSEPAIMGASAGGGGAFGALGFSLLILRRKKV